MACKEYRKVTYQNSIIGLRNVTKRYRGRMVLNGVDLTVNAEQVVGLIGPNGCGKTTILRIVSGLAQPSGGEVWIDGHPLHDLPGQIPSGLGVLFDPPGLLPHLTGFQNLRMLASLRHLVGDAEIRRWMTRLGLNPDDRKHVGTYSQGMLQRLGLAQALMESPRILLLDEPTNALDPAGVDLVADLIQEQQHLGVTVLIASHHLEEVARVCTDVFKVLEGQLNPAGEDDLRRRGLPDRDRTR